MRVLDTAALLHYPIDQLVGFVVHSQRGELSRLSETRALLVEGADLLWCEVSPIALQQARKIATRSGDLAGLSQVDLELLALALEKSCELVTDDYRLQNCCMLAEITFSTVLTEGAKNKWEWYLVCTACGTESAKQVVGKRKGEHGECKECGSPLRIRKR